MSDKKIINQTEEDEMVQREFDALLQDYLGSNHRKKTEKIIKAFHFARAAHQGLRRRSGEPYILHPIAVARIVAKEIGLGSTSICAALLHDVVEDTDYTVEDIANVFGTKIAQIVDGLTKISGGVFGKKASEQAENFRKLLLTMSDDFRVILIKIADRLHNMRTLGSMPPAKQYKIAGETEYIYAPLAHRLGLFNIKTELENLSFKYDYPDTYFEIEQKLNSVQDSLTKFYDHFSKPIQEKFESMGYQFELMKRIKSVFSIWKKMSSRGITFDEVYDILAVRIIFNPKEDMSEKDQCWMLYSAITSLYKPHPERIRDWVSTPKANGYEALHVTVMAPGGRWVEIQIRSERMNEIAEKGLAAHWKYKTGEEDESELDKWLKTLKDLLKNPEPNAIDFMDTFKLNLFTSEIFVFTPKGDIKTIAKGATALDFAFMLHSNIGYASIAAKVNHKLVSLDQVLCSGDQVEILTSKKQVPQPEWINFITTAHARAKLRDYFKKEEKRFIAKGAELINKYLHEIQLTNDNENIVKLLNYYNIRSRKELFYQAGKGTLVLDDIKNIIFKPESKNMFSRLLRNPFSGSASNGKSSTEHKVLLPSKEEKLLTIDFKKTYILNDLNFGKAYELAPCCHPIPGDEILGYVTENNVIQVHKRNCNVATAIKSNFGNRIVNIEWQAHSSLDFVEKLQIKGVDRVGIVMDILRIITEGYGVNMRKIIVETSGGLFTGVFEVIVHETKDINNLINNIITVPSVNSVQRMK
ncbi:MAG: RelA/SpoT family protein [Paludibacteraceae bacterium]